MRRDRTSFAVTAVLWLASLPGVLLAQVENVAPRGIARQSTASLGSTTGASSAINGNLGDFTLTVSLDENPTWEVELYGVFAISSVVLHNRPDCCLSRLRDITIAVLDFGGNAVWTSDLLNPENILGGGTIAGGPSSLSLKLVDEAGGPLLGHVVRVTRTSDADNSGIGGGGTLEDANVLSLAEVEVFATHPPGLPTFRRGDMNRDYGLDTSDPLTLLNWTFLGGPVPVCMDAVDADDSGELDLTDSIYLLNYAFIGGPAPPPPGSLFCGPDPTPDRGGDLGCAIGCP